MNWNKYFIDTSDYPLIGEKIGIYPEFESMIEHIRKHILSSPTLFTKLLPNLKKILDDGQKTEKIAVEVYEELAPELAKAVHFMFLSKCWMKILSYTDKECPYPSIRVYGVSPDGMVIILSSKNLLTCYFPSYSGQTELAQFANAVNKVEKKALLEKKKAKEKIEAEDYMSFPSAKFACLKNQNSFADFLRQYRELTGNSCQKEIERLIKGEQS